MNPTTRLTDRLALELYQRGDLHELGAAAHAECRRRHAGPVRTFLIDRNVNYTNICRTRCRFCAFSTDAEAAGAYVLGRDQLMDKIAELQAAGGTQVLLQGGMHPGLSLEWYVEMLADIRKSFPKIHLHAFSPPEIWFFHEEYGLSVPAVLDRLRSAGLNSIPGGGAEILVDRVRREISPRKCTTDQWLEVMRQAHAMGMMTTATMMFGHVERPAERIEHLRRLRELQDRSLEAGKGRFTAFICWTFQPEHTELGRSAASASCGKPVGQADRRTGLPPSEPTDEQAPPVRSDIPDDADDVHVEGELRLAGSVTYLRTLALARLYLDNFDNLQASWVTQGPKIGQLALFYGANDMGGIMMEENVVSAAGTTFHMTADEVRRLIRDAGYQPRQRDCYYNIVD